MRSLIQLAALVAGLCQQVVGGVIPGTTNIVRDTAQDLVTWDQQSLFVRGERIFFYSGEFHPFRLPVPDLWYDVFQKIKAIGYNGVSFYVDWALLEGNPGHFSAEGVFAWEPFFAAAAESGIYLLARPGPYINAEVSGGGFPGWLSRVPAYLRTNQTAFVEASSNYVSSIGKIIAAAQISNGGPVIAFQSENEYSIGAPWTLFPDIDYIQGLEDQFKAAGINVPFINNQAWQGGLLGPGVPGGADIYGFDSYPIGFNCATPSDWSAATLTTNYRDTHLQQTPDTPLAIVEFQGGAFDGWSGPGMESCAALINAEAERVFYKNNFAAGLTFFNAYMTFGGTNWGNLGQSGGYTSYDYGAAIKEDRQVSREKYSEAKLIARFITSSPAYLEAVPGQLTNASYADNAAISTTPVIGNKTIFYIVRQSNYQSLESTPYKFSVSTSAGNVTLPQLGGSLAINGRDSKIHVTDYDVDGINLVYSSADIYAHGKTGDKKVLLLYGLADETHELAFASELGTPIVEGAEVVVETKDSLNVVQWQVTPDRKVLHYGDDLDVYLLWRNDAHNYWVSELESPAPVSNYTSQTKETIIAKAGYLLRSATISGTALYLTGDLNATTDLEIVAGFSGSTDVYWNGDKVEGVSSDQGRLAATLTYTAPDIDIPQLTDLDWRYIDSLPEVKPGYDDSAWTKADHTTTNNSLQDPVFSDGQPFKLKTPTSLISADYGFSTGSLIYRGYFTATGNESTLYLSVQGGVATGHSIWLNDTFLTSFVGDASSRGLNQTLSLARNSTLLAGKTYVITILIDHMGQETNWWPGYNFEQSPRGILDYSLSGHGQSDVTWKLTGNLGGEQYPDQLRGPLNEGGMFAERLGYHLPKPPTESWDKASPLDGISTAGVGFYATNFDLDIPAGYDVPMSFVFGNGSEPSAFRVQLYVNGWQFGEYVNHIGPQTSFPVPEGVLNYGGTNYVAITLWAHDAVGAKLSSFDLVANAVIQSGYRKPALVWNDSWEARDGAY